MRRLIGIIALGAMLGSCCGPASTAPEENVRQDNPVVETIMARRSVRQYTDTPVGRDTLELIARCGINAPSAMNSQPWEVRIVDSKEWIDGVTGLFVESNPQQASQAGFKNMFRNAPAVIFIANPAEGGSEFDCGLLAENMMLAAQSMGLGTCCLGGPIRFLKDAPEAAYYVEKLGFSPEYKLLYAVAIGYPAEQPDAKPRDEAKIKFVD